MKVQAIGTIGVTRARLYDISGNHIGYCLDTPNAIARAFMECLNAEVVHSILGAFTRTDFLNRMQDWNTADSDLEVI